MNKFNNVDYKVHRYLSQSIIDELTPVKSRIEKNLSVKFDKIEKQKQQLKKCDSLEEIEVLSKKYKDDKFSFISDLSVFVTIEAICKKNKERISYIDNMFKNLGIYQVDLEKKILKSKINDIVKMDIGKDERIVVPDLDEYYILLMGQNKYEISERQLDLSSEYNKKLLKLLPDEVLTFALKYFPKSVSTISAEQLMDIPLKQLLLKKIANFVFDKSDKISIDEINNMLGKLLNFSIVTVKSAYEYVLEVQNLFNVKIVRKLKQFNPFDEDLINEKLKCNFSSKFL